MVRLWNDAQIGPRHIGGPRLPERAPDAGYDAVPAATESGDEPPAPLFWTPTPVRESAVEPDATASQPS